MFDARFILIFGISIIILLENKNIKLFMCFKHGEQLQITNCLAYKLVMNVINKPLGSYLCEKNLTSNLNFITNKLYF